MKKRWISLLLVSAMVIQLCSGISITSRANDGILWDVTDGVLTISGTGPMEDYTYDENTWSYNTPWAESASKKQCEAVLRGKFACKKITPLWASGSEKRNDPHLKYFYIQ